VPAIPGVAEDAPVGQLDVDALPLSDGNVAFAALEPLGAHAVLDLLGEFANAGNTGRDMAADDGCDASPPP
jgi:hypothetical protein